MGLDQFIYRLNSAGDGEEMHYFRKVNFLHRWVETHLNNGVETNCEMIPMSLEAIAGLGQTCDQVMAHPELGPERLPTQAGFFFGSTEYDASYLAKVAEVRDACLAILAHEAVQQPPGTGQYGYGSSW